MSSNEFEQIIERMLSGGASSEDRTRLTSALREQPELRRAYAAQVRLHALLEWSHGQVQAAPVDDRVVVLPLTRARFLQPLALAAAACLALLASWWFVGRNSALPITVATLTRVVDAEWSDAGTSPKVGAALRTGWLRLKSGAVQVEFIGGARVVLEGPAEFQLISAQEGFLRAGKVTAHVPERAHGFKVLARDVTVVDLGTEFGLNVDSSRASEVHVFTGKVEVSLSDPVSKRTALLAGQAARASGGELQSLAADRAAFLTEDKLPAVAPAVTPAAPAASLRAEVENPAPAAPGGELVLHLANNFIEVATHDRNEVQIVDLDAAAGNEPSIQMWQEDGKFTVKINQPGRGHHYRALVPKKFNVDLRTSGETITVTNLDGNVKARSGGGVINLARIGGDVDAESLGGRIALQSATGRVRLKSGGGQLAVGEAGGDTTLETRGGSISVLIARGTLNATTSGGSVKVSAAFGAVQARSSGGSVSVNFHGQPNANSILSTEGGSIEARVLPTLAFDVKADCQGGDVKSELPIEWQPGGSIKSRAGQLNGGTNKLTLHTSGGGIWLEALRDPALPLVEKQFQFFKPNIAQAAPSAGRPPKTPKDEFAPANNPGPAHAPGLLLLDGTHMAATIVSADDTQVVFRRNDAETESLLLSRVSALLFRPLPLSKMAALDRPRGLLLRNGDYLEGEATVLKEEKITVSSVLFGLRSISLRDEAMALVLRKSTPKP